MNGPHELPRYPRSPCYQGGNVTINEMLQALADNPQSRVIRGYHMTLLLTAGVPQVLFEEHGNRGYLLIQNRGPGNVFFSFGQAPQGDALNYPASIVLAAGDDYELNSRVIIDQVTLVSDQSNTVVSGIQGILTYT